MPKQLPLSWWPSSFWSPWPEPARSCLRYHEQIPPATVHARMCLHLSYQWLSLPLPFLRGLVQLVLLGNWVPYCPNIKFHHWVADSPHFCCAFGIAFSFAGNCSLAIFYSLGISRVLHMFQRPAFTPSQEKGCCGTPVLIATLSLMHIPCALERPCAKLEYFCKGYFMNKSMNE